MKSYLVGGAVRDELLGEPVKERDWVVVGATPEQMIELGYKPVGKDFPVFLHPQTHEEYALARTERKTAPGYHGFTFHAEPDVTLEQDLVRRDLTINAIARTEEGEIIDPYNGVSDLNKHLLRHVSDAFGEDPVRILRVARLAARFHSLDFQVASGTMDLMQQMVRSGEVDALIAERVWAETHKALQEAKPSVYFSVLRECGALEKLFPEIERLYGVPQKAEHHPEVDTGIHTMMALDQAAILTPDPQIRFAVLIHDLGKAATPEEILPSHKGHEERSVDLVRAMCERLKTPYKYRDLAVIVAKFHGHYFRIDELAPETIVKILSAMDVFRKPERFEQFLLACEADSRGRTGYEEKMPRQTAIFKNYYIAAAAVDISPFIQQKLKGEKMKQAIYKARVDAVREISDVTD
ncbi:MAG: multifunctional CCA addition/repair protein [Gammaproteobacteria bacterium]|nr:MAG: multifunctional CCA addition/repair protein [Gammaproteobacteria bacterium]